MRIRKNANLSSLMSSHAEPLQSHVCQLNQSPWDVIPFSQETYPSSLIHLQLEGEDSFNGNGSLGDSMGAVESSSFHSITEDEEEEKVDKNKMLIDDNCQEIKIQCCNKRDGKGWHCKNETKQGHSMCDHHLTSMKSCSPALPAPNQSTKKLEKNLASGRRGGRAKAAKKGTTSAANPYEFYYYSGFGPLWGKRRGGGGGINKCAEIEGGKDNTTSYSPPSSIDHFEDLDFLDEDDDEDSDDKNGESGKKRMRKPVKARSLKSLM